MRVPYSFALFSSWYNNSSRNGALLDDLPTVAAARRLGAWWMRNAGGEVARRPLAAAEALRLSLAADYLMARDLEPVEFVVTSNAVRR